MWKKRIAILLMAMFAMLAATPRIVESTCEKKQGTKDHVLVFTSDVHEKMDSNLQTLFQRLKETEIKPDYICYGGDYAQEFNKQAVEQTYQITKNYFPKTTVLMTTGNHDRIGFNQEEFAAVTKQKQPRVAVEEKGYCIYMLGASEKEQEFTQKDIEDLQVFLEKRKEVIPSVPIFIVSHYPIHYYKGEKHERTTKHAQEMVEMLNQYKNVVFLYGHNHTLEDQNYTVIHMPGDDLEIAKDTYVGIHFPYMALGAVKDGAGMDVYALKVTIEHTMCCNKVIFEHVNDYAEPKDEMLICFPMVE